MKEILAEAILRYPALTKYKNLASDKILISNGLFFEAISKIYQKANEGMVYSDGKGEFYANNERKGITYTWKQYKPFNEIPF